MGYIEYLNKEIPTWMTELRTEDEQKIHDAFMECYNREVSIKLYERYSKENPQKKESYEKSIAEIEISLAQKKEELRIITEEAKKHLKKEKGLYAQAVENVQSAIQRLQYNNQYLAEMKKNVQDESTDEIHNQKTK